jgi:hypothetical protein
LKTIWVEVFVQCPKTGIRATHYVEVPASVVYPQANAEHREREKDYMVHGSRIWKGKEHAKDTRLAT